MSWRPWAIESFRFLIVGHGAEEQWLRDRMPRAEIPGVLKGEELSTGLRQHGSVCVSLAH